MWAVIVAILSMIILGLPVVLALDRSARGLFLIGAAFLYGSGTIYFLLLTLSMLHIHWTILSVTIPALVIWSVLWFIPRPRTTVHGPLKFHWLDIPTLVTLIGFTLYATIAPLWEWDFWAIWGLKARVFLEHGGIDWQFLSSRWNVFAHPDYPLLVPLNFDFAALLAGGWSDRWLGALSAAWAVALVLIVRDLAAREASRVPAALVTLTIASIAASRYIGLAEGPMIAFGAAGVLMVRRAVLFRDDAGWRHAALFLGLAPNVKNEGLALLVSVVVALALMRFAGEGAGAPLRGLVRLWPAAAIAAPWLLLRATHDLPTDIVTGTVVGRVAYRLPYSGEIAVFLARELHQPWFWAAVLAGILIVPAARRREAFVILATAIQLVFYVGSYFATPHDARWHVVTSWPRLTEQIAVPITYAVVLMLAKYAAGVEDSPDAEARPLQR